jgi:hypothetical protein
MRNFVLKILKYTPNPFFLQIHVTGTHIFTGDCDIIWKEEDSKLLLKQRGVVKCPRLILS